MRKKKKTMFCMRHGFYITFKTSCEISSIKFKYGIVTVVFALEKKTSCEISSIKFKYGIVTMVFALEK